ncbi:hypothetical protein [Streptomyces sp. NPDC049813]|uniref:hypothetical protein n=1 Tax=Streptomyces sp. NPDC049813 TaxID=3365597 RepID=UPI0037B93567
MTQGTGLLRDARSVRMRASDGQAGRTVRSDVRIDRTGNCVGTFDGGTGNRGDMIVLAAETDQAEAYIRFSDASLAELRSLTARMSPEVAARIRERTLLAQGKYVRMPAGPKAAGPSRASAGSAVSWARRRTTWRGPGRCPPYGGTATG